MGVLIRLRRLRYSSNRALKREAFAKSLIVFKQVDQCIWSHHFVLTDSECFYRIPASVVQLGSRLTKKGISHPAE